MPTVIYLLWWKGLYEKMLFGIFSSPQKRQAAKENYIISGECSYGYFTEEEVILDNLLAKGYL